MAKRDQPWIVFECTDGVRLVCKRCRVSYAPSFPVEMPMFIGILDSFAKSHAGCKEAPTAVYPPFFQTRKGA